MKDRTYAAATAERRRKDERVAPLRAAVRNGRIRADSIDFAESMLAQFDRSGDLSAKQWEWVIKLSEQARPALPPKDTGKHFGTVGERTETRVTIKSARDHDGFYGPTIIYKLATEDGSLIVVFHSGKALHDSMEPDAELGPGATATVRFTVKEHSEYRGVKETKANRLFQVHPKEIK